MKKSLLKLSLMGMVVALLMSCSKENTDTDPGDGGDPGTDPNPPIETTGEVNSDLWTATDPLGRSLHDY